MSQLQFDADTARRIEALYQIRDAVHRRELVREALGAVRGDRVLDVGCGPGFYCLELSEIVGSSGSVVGVDSSPAMLQLARARCAGRDNVGLLEGEATALPVESGTFDGAVCVQVLEYVSDVDAALAELHRALRPGGRAVVWDVDWATVSIHSRDTALTDARAASLGRAPRRPVAAANARRASTLSRIRGRTRGGARVRCERT